MRYLLATAILVFALVAEASPVAFYRALKHLGFDNKRIAKIVIGLKERAKNGEAFSLVTQKINDISHGYWFSQKKSGELVMQKFEVRSGVPSLGQKEIIDPNLADYQLALGELVGLTGKQANEAEHLLRTGQPLDLVLSQGDSANHAGIVLKTNNGKLTQQYYLVVDGLKEFDDRELVDFAMLRQKQVQQKIRVQQRVHQALQGIIDDINNRKIIDIVEGGAKGISWRPPSSSDVKKVNTIIDEPDHLNGATQTRTQQLLSSLFSDSKIESPTEIKHLVELLDIQRLDMAKRLGLSPKNDTIGKYMNGMIPQDRFNKEGINRRRALNELFHEQTDKKLATQDLDENYAKKIHDLIDRIYRIEPDMHQLLNSLFTDPSLDSGGKIKLLSKILNVRNAEIVDKLSLSSSSVASPYKNGRSIPHDMVDKNGINKRQKLKELFHEKVDEKLAASEIDDEVATKLHDFIDELLPTNKPSTILDQVLDIDAPQKFFSARSFSEVVTDKRQGKVYLTDTELADYQTYLYDEIAEVAIETGKEKQAIALIKKHAEALDVTICDSGDCSLSLIEDYIDALEKSLIKQANKNYLDEFKPNEIAVDVVKKTTARLSETISSVAKGKNPYDKVAEGITVTKYFAKKFADLPVDRQNLVVEIIKNTSDVMKQWQETIPQEGILSYLKENVQTYQRIKKPRMGEARSVKLYTLRIDRRTTLYFKLEENDSIVLANLTTNNSDKAYDEGIKRAVSSLQSQYQN